MDVEQRPVLTDTRQVQKQTPRESVKDTCAIQRIQSKKIYVYIKKRPALPTLHTERDTDSQRNNPRGDTRIHQKALRGHASHTRRTFRGASLKNNTENRPKARTKTVSYTERRQGNAIRSQEGACIPSLQQQQQQTTTNPPTTRRKIKQQQNIVQQPKTRKENHTPTRDPRHHHTHHPNSLFPQKLHRTWFLDPSR